MARKLTTVSDHPTLHRRRGRPKTRLTSAVEASEREMLCVLRRQIATRIDEGVPTHTLTQLIRQFLAVDRDIRSIDLRTTAQVVEDEDDGDLDGSPVFNPDAI
jgi:hypothetical protein